MKVEMVLVQPIACLS
ncbi:hypothetical protein RDI58_012755 [Solanum bulbocastanum]|uniref:Uncharacterized protein n=1 Tax=Solanum bulbocastanum TaxID=147425 RepID=A0AAN8TNX2_SOLBU